MKKILFLAFAFILMAFTGFAQSVTPRQGTGVNQDNTGRVMTYNFNNVTDQVGADTVKLIPGAKETLVIPSGNIVDSLSYSLYSLANSYAGDYLVFSFTNSAGTGHLVKFVGTGWQMNSSGTKTGAGVPDLALSSGNKATIKFVFDGSSWVEESRMVQ